MHDPTLDSAETATLLEQARQGCPEALDALLRRHRDDVHAFVSLRMDPRLARRIDPSDVVQESLLEAARRMDDYLERRPMPFRLWLRKTAYERLVDLRRHHRRGRRTIDREMALPDRSSLLLARPLLNRDSSPSRAAEAREFADQVARAVATLSEADQEILLMRHGEGMPFEEVACVLGIHAAAARKRFGRALIRLQEILEQQGLLG